MQLERVNNRLTWVVSRTAYVPSVRFQSLAKKPDVPGNNEVPKVVDLPEEPGEWVPGKSQKGARSTEGTEKSPNRGGGDSDDDIAVVAVTDKEGSGHGEECAAEDKVEAEDKGGGSPLGEGNGTADCSEDNDITVVAVINKTGELNAHRPRRRHRNGGRYSLEDIRKQIGDLTVQSVVDKLLKEFALQYCVKNRGNGRWVERNSAGNEEQSIPEIDKCTDGRGKAASGEGAVESERSRQSELHYEKGRQVEDCIIVDDCTVEDCTDLIDNSTDVNSRQSLEGACAIVNKDRSHEDCISLTSPHNKLHPEQIRNDVIQNGSSRGVQKRGRSLGSPLPRVHSTETLSVNDDKEEVVINRSSRNNQRLVETAKKRSISAPGSRRRLRTGHLIQSKKATRNEVITKIKEHKSIASETEEKLPVISVEDERVEKTESEIKEHSSVVGEIPSVKVKKERSHASLVKGRGLVQAISTEKNESNQIIVSDTKNVVQETREQMADNEELSVKNDAHLKKGKTKTDQSSSIKDQGPVVTVRKVTNHAVTIKGRSIKLANATKIKERNQDEDHITGDESKNLVKDAAERLGVVSPLADRTEISAVNDEINREKDESPSSKGRSPTFKVRKGRNRIEVKRHIIKSANATENKKGNQCEDWVTGDEPKDLVKDTGERLTDESPLADRREISTVNDVINQEKDESPSSKGRSPTFKVRKGRNRIKVKRRIIKSANATENKKGNQSGDWVTGDEPKNLVKDTGDRLKGESPLADRREISAGNDVDQERGNSTSIKEKSSVVTIEKENHHSVQVNGQASAPAIVTGNKEGSQIEDCTAVNRHQSSAPETGATHDSTSDLVNETRNDVDCKEEQGEIEKPSVKDQRIISPGKEGRNRTVLAKTQTVETKKESRCISASVHKTNDVDLKEGDPHPVVTTKNVRPCVDKIESCSSKQANATANQIRNQVEDFRTEDELKSISKKICTNLVDVPALMDKNGMLLGYDVDHMAEQGEIEEGSSVNDQSLDISAKKESNSTVLVKRLGSKQVDISDKKKGNHSEDCIIVNGPSQDSGEKHVGISAVGGLSVVNAVDPKKVERDQCPVVTDNNVQIRPPLVKRLHSGTHNISQHRRRTGPDTAIKELKLFSECFVVLERLKEIPPAVKNREVKPAEKCMDQYDSGNKVEHTKQARGQEILVSNGGTRTEVKSLIEKLTSSSFENKNTDGESAAVINQYGTDVDDGRGDEMEVVEDSSVEKNSQEKSAVDIDKERATLNVEPSRAESTSDKSVAPNVECEQTIRDTSEDSYQRSPGELNVIEAREITENVPKPVVEEVGVLLVEKEDESESDNTSRTEDKERTSDWRIEKEIMKDGVVVQRKGQIEKYVVAEPANYLKETEDKGTDGGWTAGSERSKVVMEDEVLKENKDEGKIEDTNKTEKETMVGEYVCVMETEETSAEDQVLKETEVQIEKSEVERKNEYSDEAKDKETDEESMLVKKKEQLIVQDKAKKHVIEKDPKEMNELNNEPKVTKHKSYRKIDKQAVVEESIPHGEREKQSVSDEGGEKAGGEIEKHLVGKEDKDKTEDTNETCNRTAAEGNTSERRSEEVIVEDEVIKIPEVVEDEDAKVPKVAEDEVAKVPIVKDVVAKLPEVVADKIVKNCEVVEDDVANIPKVVDEVAKIRKVIADDVPKIFKHKNEVAKVPEVDVDEVVKICKVVEDEVARIPKVIDEVAKNRIVEDEVAKILQVIADGVANIPKHDDEVAKIPEVVVDEVVKIAKVQIENSSVKIAKAASEMKDNRIFVESTLDKKRKSMFVGDKVVKKEGELIGKEDSREGKDTRLGKDKILVAENTSDKKREKMDVEDKIEMSLVKRDDREIVKTKGLKDKKMVGEYSLEQRKDKVLKKTEEQNKTCLSETKRKRKIVVRTLGKKREKQIVKNEGAEGTKELNEKSVLGKEGECKTMQERQRVIGEYIKGMKEKQMVKDGMCAGGKEMGYIRKGIKVHTVENQGQESPGVEANEGKYKKTVALKEVHRLLKSPRDENEESTSRKITGEEKDEHLQVKGTLQIKEGKETDKSPAEQTSSKPKFRVRRRLKSDDTGVRKSKVVMTEEMRRRKFEKYLAERKRVGLLKNYTVERVGSQMSSEDRKEKGLSDEVCKAKKEEPQIRKSLGEKSVENKDKVKSPQIKKSPGKKIVENKDKVKSPLMKKSPGEKSAENMDKVESPFEKPIPGMRKEQMEISKDEIARKKCRIKKKLGKKSEKIGEGQIEKRQAKPITENKDLKHITKHAQESKRLLTKQYSVNEEVIQFGEQADKKIEEKVKEISRDGVTEMTGESQGKYVTFESKKQVQIENSAQRPIGTKEAEENIERLGRSISVAESKVQAAGESKDKMPEEETFIEQKKSDMETAVNEKIPVGQDFIFKGVQNQTEVCPLAAENKILNDASLVMNESNLKDDEEIISELDDKTQQTEARIVVEDRQELNSEFKFVHIENCLIVKDEMSENRECVVVKEGDGSDKITEEEERQLNQCTMVQKVMNQEYKIIELSPQVKKGEILSQEQKRGEDVTMMIEGANEVQDSASQKEEKTQNEESTEVIQNGELTSRNRGGQSGDCAIVTEEKGEVQGVQEGDGEEEKYGLLSEESRETDCSKREEVVSGEHLAMSREVQVKEHVMEEERETEAAKGEGSPVTSTERAREVCRIENEGLSEVGAGTSDVHVEPIPREECSVEGEGSGQSENQRIVECFVDAEESKIIEDEECKAHEDVKKSAVVEEQQNDEPEIRTKMQDGVKEDETQFEEGNKSQGNVQGSIAVEEEKQTVEVIKDAKDVGLEDVEKCVMHVEKEKECEVGNKPQDIVEVKMDAKDEGLEDVEKCVMPVEEEKEDNVCEVGIQEGVEVKMDDKDEGLEDVEKYAMPVEGKNEEKVGNKPQEVVEVKMDDKAERVEDMEKCAMPVEGEKQDKECEVGNKPLEDAEVKMDNKVEGLEDVEKCAVPVEENQQDIDCEVENKPHEDVEVKMDDKVEGVEDVEKCAMPVEGEKEDKVCEVGIQESVEVKMDDKDEGLEDVEKCAMPVEGEKEDKVCEVGIQEGVEVKMDDKDDGLEDVEKCAMPVEEDKQDRDCEVGSKPQEVVEVKMDDTDEGVEDVEKCAMPVEGEKEGKVFEVGIQEGVEVKMDDKDEGVEDVEKCAMAVEGEKQDKECEVGNKPQEDVEVKMDKKVEGLEDVEKCAVPVEENQDKDCEVENKPHEDDEVKMEDKDEGVEDVEKSAIPLEGEKLDKVCEVGNKPQEVVEVKMDGQDEGLEDVEKCAMPVEEEEQDKDCEVENKPPQEESDKQIESGIVNKMQGEAVCVAFEEEGKQNEVCDVRADVERSVMIKENEEITQECVDRSGEVLGSAKAKEAENKDRATENSTYVVEESKMEKEEFDFGITRKAEGKFDESEIVTGGEKQIEEAGTEIKTEESIKSEEEERLSKEYVVEKVKIGELSDENKSQAQSEKTVVIEELSADSARQTNVENESLKCLVVKEEEIHKVCESSLDIKDDKEIDGSAVESQQEVKIEDSVPDGNLSIPVESTCASDVKVDILSEVCRPDREVEGPTVISGSENQIAICTIQTEGEGEIDLCTIEKIRQFIESTVEGREVAQTGLGIVNNLEERCGSICSVDSSGKRQLCICGIENEGQVCSFETGGEDSGHLTGYTVENGGGNFTCSDAVKDKADGQILFCSVSGEEPRVLQEHMVHGNTISISVPTVEEGTHVGPCLADIEMERHVKVCTIENESERHIGDCTVEGGLDPGARCCTVEITRVIEREGPDDVNRELGASRILYDQDGGIITLIQNADAVRTNVTESCGENGEPVIQVHITEDGVQKGESDFESEAEPEAENELEEEVVENVNDLGETIIEEFVDKDTWENQIVIVMEGVEAVQVETPAAEPGVENAKKRKGKVSPGVRQSKPRRASQSQETPKRPRGRPKRYMRVEADNEGPVNKVQQNANGRSKKARIAQHWKNDTNMLEGHTGVQQNSYAGSHAKKIILTEDGYIFPPLGLVTKAMLKQMPDGVSAFACSYLVAACQKISCDVLCQTKQKFVTVANEAFSSSVKESTRFSRLVQHLKFTIVEHMDMTPVGGTERKFEGKWKKAMISKVMHKEAQLAAAEIEKALGNDPLERSGIRKSLRRRSRSQGSKASAMNVDNREPVYTENVWREALESPMIISGMKTVGNDPLEWANQKGGRRSRSQGNEPSAMNMDERDPAYTEHVWREALESPVIIPGVKEVRTGSTEDCMNVARMSPRKLAYEMNLKKNGDSPVVPKQKMVRRPKKAIVPLPQKKMFRRFKEIPQNIKADFKNKLLESVQLVRRIILTRKDLMNGVLKAGKPIVKGGTQILSIMTDSEEEDIVPKQSDNIDGTVAKPALSQSDQPHVTTSPLKEVQNGPTENELEKKDVDNVPPSNCKPKFKKPRVARAPKKLKQEAEVIVQDAICSMPDLPITPVENTVVTNGLPESDAQKMMVVENLPSVDQSQLEETFPAELTDNGEGHALSEVPPKHQGLANGLLESSNIEQKNKDEVPESNTIKPSSEQKAPSTLETKDIPNGEVLTDGPTVPLVQHKDQVEKPQEKKVKKKKKKVKVAEGVDSGRKPNDLPLKQEDKKNAKTLDKVEESNGLNVRNSARPPVTAPPKKVLTASLREKNAKNKAVEITFSKKPEEGPKGISSPLKALEAPVAGSLKQKAVTCPLANCAGKDSCADKLGCSILPLKENDIVSALPSLEELMGPSTTTPSPLKDEAAKKEEAKPQPILPLKKKISREIQSKATAVEENSESPDAEQKKIIEKLMGSDPKKKRSRAELLLMDMFAANSVGKVSEKEKPVTEKPVVKKIRVSPVVSSQTKTPPDKSPENGPKKVKPQGLILIDLFKKEKERKLLKKSDKKDVANVKSSPKEGLKSPVTSPKHKFVKDGSSTEKVAQSAEVKTTGTENRVVKKLKTVSVKEYLKRKHSQEEVREGLTAKKLKPESKDNATSSTVPNLSTDPKKSDGKKQPEKERRKSIQSISSEGQEGHDAKKLKPESKENTASSSLPNLSVDSPKSDGKKPVEKERRKSDRKTVQNIPYGMEASTPNKKTEKTPVLDGSCPAQDEKLPRCSNETEVSGADGTAEVGQEGHDAKKLKPESEGNTASSNLPNLSADSQKSDEKKPVEKERRRSDRKSVQNIPYGMRDSSPNKKTEVLDGSCPAADEKFPRCSNETDVSGAGGTAQTLNGELSNGIANGLQSPETVMSGTKDTTKIAINDVNHSLPLQQIFKLRECFVLLHRLPEDTVNGLRPFRRKVKKRKKINTRAAVPGAGDETSTCDNSAVLERLSPSTKENISSPLPAGEEQHSSPQSPSKKQLHVCAVCGERFLAASILYAHTKKHSQEESSSSPDRKTVVLQDRPRASVRKKQGEHCPYCLRNFKGKKNFVQHLKKHSDAKACKCYMCDITFLTYYNLFVHMRTHTKEHIYPCYICQKTFAHPSTLQIHIEKHHTKKRFKCFSCEKSFMSVINRSAHMKKHHENGPV